jgi:alpha-glucosidase
MHRGRSSSLRSVFALLLAAALALSLSPPTATAESAAGAWTIHGPARSTFSAQVRLDAGTGAVTMSVSRQGREVLLPAPVGITTADAELTRGLTFTGKRSRTVHERYRMTTGKQRDRAALMRESRLAFRADDGTRLDLVIRVSDDGVAYRYVLPDSGGTTATGEASAYSLPADARAWLQPYNPQHENKRAETGAAEAATGEYGNPSLFQVGQDYALLTESDVDGTYSGARLYHEQGSGTYQVRLADEQISSTGTLRTPWRTAIVGDLATVAESTLVDDLADSTRFEDTSWIRPGKVAWSWLSEHSSPRSLERQKDYVDFADAQRVAVCARGRGLERAVGARADPLRANQGCGHSAVVPLEQFGHRRGTGHGPAAHQELGCQGREGRLHGVRHPVAVSVVRHDSRGHRM